MPMITSVSAKYKSKLYSSTNTEVATEEDTVARKKKFLSILDKATNTFMDNLDNGTVQLNDTLALERLIKLSLLVSGEPDSITGKSGKEISTEIDSGDEMSIEMLEKLLTLEDPEVKSVYDKLFNNYNKQNEEEGLKGK